MNLNNRGTIVTALWILRCCVPRLLTKKNIIDIGECVHRQCFPVGTLTLTHSMPAQERRGALEGNCHMSLHFLET